MGQLYSRFHHSHCLMQSDWVLFCSTVSQVSLCVLAVLIQQLYSMWCSDHLSFISQLWQCVNLSSVVCLQISAVHSAQSLSREVGLRITCWAASRLLPYLTTVSTMSQKWMCFLKRLGTLMVALCMCSQRTCWVKTAESAPSVWRIWYRERPLPGWLASASTIRGIKVQSTYLHYNNIQTDTNEKRGVKMQMSVGEIKSRHQCLWQETFIWLFPELNEMW